MDFDFKLIGGKSFGKENVTRASLLKWSQKGAGRVFNRESPGSSVNDSIVFHYIQRGSYTQGRFAIFSYGFPTSSWHHLLSAFFCISNARIVFTIFFSFAQGGKQHQGRLFTYRKRGKKKKELYENDLDKIVLTINWMNT